MEGFLCYEFGGLIIYLEGLIHGGLIFGTLRYLQIMLCSRKTPFLLGLPDKVSFIVNNKVIHI